MCFRRLVAQHMLIHAWSMAHILYVCMCVVFVSSAHEPYIVLMYCVYEMYGSCLETMVLIISIQYDPSCTSCRCLA